MLVYKGKAEVIEHLDQPLRSATGSFIYKVRWGTNDADVNSGGQGQVNVTLNVAPPAPVDTTPPAITSTVVGTAGSNGWYTSNATVSWSVTDVESAVTIDTGCGVQAFTTETAGTADRGMLRFASVFDVSAGLLVLQQGSQRQDLLVTRGLLHLLGGWSLGRVELAAHLPIALWQESDFSFLTAQGVTGPLLNNIASTTLR